MVVEALLVRISQQSLRVLPGYKAYLHALQLVMLPLLWGCSPAVVPYSPLTSSTPALQEQRVSASHGAWHVEVESVEQQALNAILAMPAQFVIDFSENYYAWERAQLFFDLNTSERAVLVDPESGSEVVSNRNGSYDNFWYSVKRSPTNEGVLYRVSVVPRTPSEAARTDAVINAGNLARFIRDGILERSFIKR